MLKDAILNKRCLIVCGGGGVGKTTIAASLGIAATRYRNRVLVVTIDPSKRLAEAFGFTEQALIDGGEPLVLSSEVKEKLGISPEKELSVGILNPKYVLDQILNQTLPESQRERLKKTLLFSHLSNMIYGLQEYTAYEWVTRMIQKNEYDFIVLDTPPAAHAKDFFNVPERVQNLMESRVFQIFVPKKKTWFSKALSFSWLEKLLGERIYSESRVFFETFHTLRDRILERCVWLARFFSQKEVSVITVTTTESSGQFELAGLVSFLKQKNIPLESIIINQVETSQVNSPLQADEVPGLSSVSPAVIEKLRQLENYQKVRAERAQQVVERTKQNYPDAQVFVIPMVYAEDGFEILRSNSGFFN